MKGSSFFFLGLSSCLHFGIGAGEWQANQIFKPLSGCRDDHFNFCFAWSRDQFNEDPPCGHDELPDCILVADRETVMGWPGRCGPEEGHESGECHNKYRVPKGIDEETGQMSYLHFTWQGNHDFRQGPGFQVAFWGITPYAYNQLCGESFFVSDDLMDHESCMSTKLYNKGCQSGPSADWDMDYMCKDDLGAEDETSVVAFAQHLWRGSTPDQDLYPTKPEGLPPRGKWYKNQLFKVMDGCKDGPMRERMAFCNPTVADEFLDDVPCGHGDHKACIILVDRQWSFGGEKSRCHGDPDMPQNFDCHTEFLAYTGKGSDGVDTYLKMRYGGNQQFRQEDHLSVGFWGISAYAYKMLCKNSHYYHHHNPDDAGEYCMLLDNLHCMVGEPDDWNTNYFCNKEITPSDELHTVTLAIHLYQPYWGDVVERMPEIPATPAMGEWFENQLFRVIHGCEPDVEYGTGEDRAFCYPSWEIAFLADEPCGHDGLGACLILGDHLVEGDLLGECHFMNAVAKRDCGTSYQVPIGVDETTGETKYLEFVAAGNHRYRKNNGLKSSFWGITPYAYRKMCENSFYFQPIGSRTQCMPQFEKSPCQVGEMESWTQSVFCDHEITPENEYELATIAQHMWTGSKVVGPLIFAPTNPPNKDKDATKTAPPDPPAMDAPTVLPPIGDNLPINPWDYTKIDLVWLQDLSESFEDDVDNVVLNVPGVFGLISKIATLRVAAASFRDKPVEPLGYEDVDYCFKLEQDFGTVEQFKASAKTWKAEGGADYAEAVSDAMIQAANLDWRLDHDTLRLMVIVTDAPAHHPNDGLVLGLDYNDFPNTNYDCATSTYFSPKQVKRVMEGRDIHVIFLAASAVVDFYKTYLGIMAIPGSVNEISEDSGDIEKALLAGVKTALRAGRAGRRR